MRHLLTGALARFSVLILSCSLVPVHTNTRTSSGRFSQQPPGIRSLVLMAYSSVLWVAWPDRVVKRRLFKWLMRGR
jgi:hypothetical protein